MPPRLIPTICGTVRRKPYVAPDASNIALFGPGVIDWRKQTRQKPTAALVPRSQSLQPLPRTRGIQSYQGSLTATAGMRIFVCAPPPGKPACTQFPRARRSRGQRELEFSQAAFRFG